MVGDWIFNGKVGTITRCPYCAGILATRRYPALQATFRDCTTCLVTWEIGYPFPQPGVPTVDLLEPSAHRRPWWRRR